MYDNPASRLRVLLDAPGTIVVPGAYNALTAQIFQQEGFEVVYVGGHGAAAGTYGLPDVGLVTQTEMAEHVARIANAVSIPVVADADEGYGDLINVVRTVNRFERAGAAAIQFEDQQMPKRCGHMEGKRLISGDAMVRKVRAAAETRKNPDTVIIARTDAIAVSGLDDAIRRLQAYAAAGADVLFPEAVRSLEEIKTVVAAVGKPIIVNISEGGKTPLLELSVLRELGIKIALYPSAALFAAAHSARMIARSLRDTGSTSSLLGEMVLFDDFNALAGLDGWRSIEDRYVKS